MALLTGKRLNPSPASAQSRPFPNLPAQHATRAKAYIAVVTVPAADDAVETPTVAYLDTPSAHATDDKVYVLSLTVTGDDTTGGSTAVPSWVENATDLTP